MLGLRKQKSQIDPELADERERFERDGYLILEGFVEPGQCDQVVAEADRFYESQGVTAERADRTMNLHHASPAAREILLRPRTREVVSTLLGADAVFFQSIYFNTGSQQGAHSDHMFMSTEPDDQLLGFWLACEDVREGAGELLYYPGSHKLPLTRIHEYYEQHAEELHRDIEERGDELRERYRAQMEGAGQTLLTAYFYDRWEQDHHRQLAEGGFEPATFLPRKGDVLLWHAKLAHGGSEVTRPGATRRSLVAHYMSDAMRTLYEMNWVDSRRPLSLRKVKRRIRGSAAPDLYLKG
jgi:ectoine hydroxylase-related dioxygenase (phytanoyl-CoA dioxygenase family)